MKKIFIMFLFLTTVVTTSDLFAFSISTGANIWYAWYDPGFKNEIMGKNEITSTYNNFSSVKPASFVYAGMVSGQFTDRFAIGGVFSFGTGWKFKSDYIYNPSGTEIHMYKNVSNMDRYEGDLTFNYSINNIFRIFCGWKHLAEKGTGNYYFLPTGAIALPQSYLDTLKGDFDIFFQSYGPGTGLTAKFNVFDNLYFIMTLSGIYQKSSTKIEVSGYSNRTDEYNEKYVGGNNLINFAYVLPETYVTLSIGGRYQYLKNMDNGGDIKFYGIMVSTIYTFNI